MKKEFWNKKNVLVTGGAGFIGSHLVDQLIKRGAMVTVCVNVSTPTEKIEKNLLGNIKKITLVKCDLSSSSQTKNIADGQQIVFHLAGLDGNAVFKEKFAAEIFQKNTHINLNILEAAKNARVERFLFASSIDVYPNNIKGSKLHEDIHIGPEYSIDLQGYAWSKRIGELSCHLYKKQYGMKIAISRAGNIYGPRDYEAEKRSRVIPVFIDKILKGEEITIWGDGTQMRSFLYVSDLVYNMLLLAEKHAESDPVNIASERVITLNELAKMIARLCKKKAKISYVSSKKRLDRGKIIDVKKAKSLIGFKEEVSLENGLMKTIKYFSEL